MNERPPADPADHARDFALRWFDVLDRYAAERMERLGLPSEQIGPSDYEHGIPWCAFNPHEQEIGGVAPGGRITVDSGVLNPEQMEEFGPAVSGAWAESRLRDRIDAAVAHEFEEARGGTHEYAVEHAPTTELPITDQARRVLKAIAEGLKGRDP
jgi:hypothetical protein